jgi:hypothetical protein
MRGEIIQSLHANSGGMLLGLLALLAGPWLLISGMRGRWWIEQPQEWLAVAVTGSSLLVTLIDWSFRLAGF